MRDASRTKQRIDETAIKFFVRKGVDATTIRDIAGGARIAEGTIYRHYTSKEAMVAALFSENYARFTRELDEVQGVRPDLEAKLAAMIRAFCAFFDSEPELFSFLLLVQHQQLHKVSPNLPNAVDLLRTVIAEGIRRREIKRQDPELAAALVLGVVLRPAIFRIYGRIEGPMGKLANRLAKAAWQVLQV